MKMRHRRRLALVVAVVAASGCARQDAARIVVPLDLLRGNGYGPEGEAPRSRYVVRMTDGERDWEFQLPEIATAYEVKVPLQGKPASPLSVDLASLTAADREIIGQREADGKTFAVDGEPSVKDAEGTGPVPVATGTGPGAAAKTGKEGKKKEAKASYLLTLARIKELYRTRNYEIALIEIVELQKQYPDDERILTMKGSIHEKLGQTQLAREAWQSALAVNPYNLAVLEALQRLGK